MNLTTSHAANLHSPAFDIVAKHPFQRCKCGCGELVNRTWSKGHCNRMREGHQEVRVEVLFSQADYAQLKLDAEMRDIGMSALLRECWKRECGR